MRRLPQWILERPGIAFARAAQTEIAGFPHLLAAHTSPLFRKTGHPRPDLQRGKEANVSLAAARLDRLIVRPNQIFSHHHVVGRANRFRGFRKGLELRDGQPTASMGGGLCQVSNSFYWVALQAGMRIVERHRHGLDLFPDEARTVPFGGGATVVYNYADFRFENPLVEPILIRSRIDDHNLITEIWTTTPPDFRVEVEEVEHRFFQRDAVWWRENRLRRRFVRPDGRVLLEQEVAHNVGRLAYEPKGGEQISGEL